MSETNGTKPAVTAQLDNRARLELLSILPPQGNLVTLRLLQDLKRTLAFTAAEIEELEIKPTDDGFTWQHNRAREFAFNRPEADLIETQLRKLDKAEKLTPACLPLWALFCDRPAAPTPSKEAT